MEPDSSTVGRALERVGRFSADNPRAVVGLTLVLFLVAGTVAAATVQLNMGVALYVNDDSETARDWATVESGYDRGNVVFVVVETGDRAVTDPEVVRLVDRFDERYTGIDRIDSVRSLADAVRMGAGGEVPDTERGVERALDRVAARSPTGRTLTETMRPGANRTVLLLSYGDVAPPPESGGPFDLVATKDSEVVEDRVTTATESLAVPPSVSVTTTGAALFENAALTLMVGDVLTLFAGGFVLVLVVVYAVMRRRLERGLEGLLSLGATLVSLVVMLGVMGALGYDFNAIMMSVLPVGLGLGVDYGLQIQTRYRQERDRGRSPDDAAGVAARTTGRTLLLAAATTVVGFGSLFLAPIPPVRQFGVTAGTSVVVSMVLSVTLLLAVLVALDDDGRPTSQSDGDHEATQGVTTRDADGRLGPPRHRGVLETVVDASARAAYARPLLIVLLVLPAVVGGGVVYADIETTQEMLDYWPQDLEERAAFERTTESLRSPKTVYVLVEADDPYAPETVRDVAAFQQRVAANPNVVAVGGPVSAVTARSGGERLESTEQVRRLVARQSQRPLATVTAPSRRPGELLLTLHVTDVRGTAVRTLIDHIEAAAAETAPGSDVAVTGKPVVNRVIIENVTDGYVRMTVTSFVVAFVVLVVAFRSVRDPLVLVVSVPATTALLMLGAMFLLDIPWNPGTVSISSIALGIGIDYGLHVHERYRELLATRDLDERAAMRTALRRLSRPVFGSGLTTIAGFGVLLVSRFPVVRNFGKTLVLVIGFALFATFVTFPAVTFLTERLAQTGRPTPRVGPGRGSDGRAGPPATGTDTLAPDGAGGAPATLGLRARGRELRVGDGDTVGREVRELVRETGGDRDEVLWIHPEHLRFVREDGRFVLENLGDETTRVNGTRLERGERRRVGPGDEVRLSGVVSLSVVRGE
ncbi:MAG: MMPL family transporter [Haloarculaceae archaeon]